MAKKATKAEDDLRVKECLKLQLQGYTRPDIHEYASKKWNLSRGAIDTIVNKATERLKEVNKTSIEETLATVTSNYWQLYRDARKQGQLATAKSVLDQICRIKGIERYTITHVIEDQRELENATDEDLDSILVEYTKSSD
jgi:hypothetical protein